MRRTRDAVFVRFWLFGFSGEMEIKDLLSSFIWGVGIQKSFWILIKIVIFFLCTIYLNMCLIFGDYDEDSYSHANDAQRLRICQ